MSHTVVSQPLAGVEARPGAGRYAVFDHGAHVTAWQPDGQRPVLWMSARSTFQQGQPIRGGVPVVFPWFASGRSGTLQPAHGFARRSTWTRRAVHDALEREGRLEVEYGLDAADLPPQPGFPHAFRATLRVVFASERFEIGLEIENSGDAPFTFEEALHTYLAVGDVRRARLEGLEGCAYVERAGGGHVERVQDGAVTIAAEADRIYAHSGVVLVRDPAWGRTLRVTKTGSAETVVWNPWIDRARAMPDFGDDDWTGMVCVEACNLLDHAVALAPGEKHCLVQRVAVE